MIAFVPAVAPLVTPFVAANVLPVVEMSVTFAQPAPNVNVRTAMLATSNVMVVSILIIVTSSALLGV